MDNNTLLTVKQREEFFIVLYKKAFPIVAHYVARTGGSFEEAQDVFQDALVVYYEKVVSSQTETIANEKAYIVGIAKRLWLQRFKAASKNERLGDFDIATEPEEQIAQNKVLHYLETAGKKCMELLKTYYYDHLSVNNVVERFGYSGTHSATVAKYKCLEKVRDTIKQKSLEYADFVE